MSWTLPPGTILYRLGHHKKNLPPCYTKRTLDTVAGELCTWGSGVDARLGHGDCVDQFAPKCVEALRGELIVAVSAGMLSTIAVSTHDCGVFGWGRA